MEKAHFIATTIEEEARFENTPSQEHGAKLETLKVMISFTSSGNTSGIQTAQILAEIFKRVEII